MLLAGLRLLWSQVLSPAARTTKAPPQLTQWIASPTEALLFLLHALLGGFGGSVVAAVVAVALHLQGDQFSLVGTAGMHLGMLAGVVVFHRANPGALGAKPGTAKQVFSSGLATFLIAMPVVFIAGFAWMGLMKLAGIPVERQPAVALFTRLKSPFWMAFMVVTAGIVAPITEELVFRLGLFRYLRTRVSRWAALLLPAVLFAASHVDLNTFGQLALLGVLFSLAYERTGMIGTAMVAHALFNLNSVFLLLAGVVV
jgi:membrane protease YdiL (CAAX protease family)